MYIFSVRRQGKRFWRHRGEGTIVVNLESRKMDLEGDAEDEITDTGYTERII